MKKLRRAFIVALVAILILPMAAPATQAYAAKPNPVMEKKAEAEKEYFVKLFKEYGYDQYAKDGDFTRGESQNGEYYIKGYPQNTRVFCPFVIRVRKNGMVYYTINGQPYYTRSSATSAFRKYAYRMDMAKNKAKALGRNAKQNGWRVVNSYYKNGKAVVFVQAGNEKWNFSVTVDSRDQYKCRINRGTLPKIISVQGLNAQFKIKKR